MTDQDFSVRRRAAYRGFVQEPLHGDLVILGSAHVLLGRRGQFQRLVEGEVHALVHQIFGQRVGDGRPLAMRVASSMDPSIN